MTRRRQPKKTTEPSKPRFIVRQEDFVLTDDWQTRPWNTINEWNKDLRDGETKLNGLLREWENRAYDFLDVVARRRGIADESTYRQQLSRIGLTPENAKEVHHLLFRWQMWWMDRSSERSCAGG
jgi:hypothetical protein